MSASDDTQKKLIESIRKSKQSSTGTSRGQAAARTRTTRKTATKATAGDARGGDAYQFGRRVWPD